MGGVVWGAGEIQGERGREKKASFSTKFFLPYVDMAQRERARARDKKNQNKTKQNKKNKLKKAKNKNKNKKTQKNQRRRTSLATKHENFKAVVRK